MGRPNRHLLDGWVLDALRSLGGKGTIVAICKWVWDNHQHDLQKQGELFYTWQYDIRWVALVLRTGKVVKTAQSPPKGVWELA